MTIRFSWNPLMLGEYRVRPDERHWLARGAILYSTCDEDSWSEITGLELSSDDIVLSVTGSGCRTLNLLIGNPGAVVSVDANPLQNHLLELKIAAIRQLDRLEFTGFIGLRPREDRPATYQRIRSTLSEDAREFWDRNVHVIDRGVLYSGAHEQFYARYIGPLIRVLRPGKRRRMFEFTSIDEQMRFFDREWDTPRWRAALRLLARPSLVRRLLPDPSYYAFIERESSVADYLNSRLRDALGRHLAADNHLLALLLLGRYRDDRAVPPYLSPEHYETVRKNLDAIRTVTRRLDAELAETPAGTYSKFSLSDIAGWTTPDDFDRILEEVVRTAKPGGRLCYRNFLSDRRIPARIKDLAVERADIAERLRRSDISIAFSFVVADLPHIVGTRS
ncbi:DUF3419 family protein [Amycolatopsis sp. NPDC059090]|uniref:DUF3419 family protein n=1 Tax=unclassified Amycolatopsis TaxID=2618356 RepID=UPI00366D0C1C